VWASSYCLNIGPRSSAKSLFVPSRASLHGRCVSGQRGGRLTACTRLSPPFGAGRLYRRPDQARDPGKMTLDSEGWAACGSLVLAARGLLGSGLLVFAQLAALI
jgi:hypothetical protein